MSDTTGPTSPTPEPQTLPLDIPVSDTTSDGRLPEKISVRIDKELSDNLLVLMCGGARISTAVQCAVAFMADSFRAAWDHGIVPHGTIPPDVIGFSFAPPPVSDTTTPVSDSASEVA